jgi:site-specific DNA-cytosine methylase
MKIINKETDKVVVNNNSPQLKPTVINSSLVSAQNRVRLYWTNWEITQPEDKNISLYDILEETNMSSPAAIRGRRINKGTIVGRRLNKDGKRADYDREIPITQCLEVRGKNTDKSNCITTADKDNVLTTMPIGRHPNAFKLNLPFRYYTLIELCRLQTIPEHYFKDIVSSSQARKMIGNGWTVDVFVHLFSQLK